MALLSEVSRRFFHPACGEEMLEAILPSLNGLDLNVMSSGFYSAASSTDSRVLVRFSRPILSEHISPSISSNMATNANADMECGQLLHV